MAQTDEEKVAAAVAKEVEPEKAAETEEDQEQPEPAADEPAEGTEEEQDKPEETEEPEASTFTKPEGYEWVKGDNQDEFIQNLIVAYQNSSAEALRLRQATAPQPAPAAPAPEQSVQAPVASPELAYAQSMMQKDQIDSFEKFAEKFPQAREPGDFDRFSKALEGTSQAFLATNGRLPTYSELFEGTASFLQWSPSDKSARKDAAIKDASTSGNTQATGSAHPKRSKIDSPDVAKTVQILKSRPEYANKSDMEIMKELSEVPTS